MMFRHICANFQQWKKGLGVAASESYLDELNLALHFYMRGFANDCLLMCAAGQNWCNGVSYP